MEVVLADKFRESAIAQEAQSIIGDCVQCGLCVPSCPTHRLLGDDWDSPRGRINLFRELLEDKPPSADARLHIDRCLTCRACEAVCPEHVRYGRLLDITRELFEPEAGRSLKDRLLRRAVRAVVPHRGRFTALLALGRVARKLLPAALRERVPLLSRVPEPRPTGPWPTRAHGRAMLVWEGCVQPALAPDINAATARVLDRCGIRLQPARAGCCGAMSQHMAAPAEARQLMRRNIDACWSQIESGVEAIVITASGCAAHLRDYADLLRDDPAYADKARRFAALTRDIAEVVTAELDAGRLPVIPPRPRTPDRRVAWQAPCSLQHAQGLKGVVDRLLKYAGYTPTPIAYPFLCCGAAGSYSILQPEMARDLRAAKLETIMATRPKMIVTANIGCLHHLAEAATIPVRHWIDLLDETLAETERQAVSAPALTPSRQG